MGRMPGINGCLTLSKDSILLSQLLLFVFTHMKVEIVFNTKARVYCPWIQALARNIEAVAGNYGQYWGIIDIIWKS